MWKKSLQKLIRNWQRDTCTTKAGRKIHTQLGRKRRKAIRDSEEKGDYTGEYPPWGVAV